MLYYSNEEADLERKNYALRLNWRDTGAAVYRLRMDEPVSLEDYGSALISAIWVRTRWRKEPAAECFRGL